MGHIPTKPQNHGYAHEGDHTAHEQAGAKPTDHHTLSDGTQIMGQAV
jgi:hypothetical protein